MRTDDGRGTIAVILAAGEGTRMRSARPKVLHEIAGLSLVGHVVRAVADSGIGRVAVVVGPDRADVAMEAARHAAGVAVFEQRERRGTAHAALAARAALEQGCHRLVVLFGDTPLVTPATIGRLLAALDGGAAVAVLAFRPADPAGYGRVLTDGSGVIAIREHKDASDAERAVGLCNAGLMAFDGRDALAILDAIGSANAQGEFYLTDAVEVARARGRAVAWIEAAEAEVMGVNDRAQLAAAGRLMQERLRERAMRGGVTMIAPETVHVAWDTVFGRDVVIEPNVFIGPGVRIEDDAVIHASSHLVGAEGKSAEGVVVGSGVHVGPFARLRPGARLAKGAKVGNFVEIKAADIGPGAKVSHLTYIGDASVGADANIGAGTITCNYDGFLKYRTEIGARAFIGSNSALVAPVRIGEGAIVGAGSVVTKDVAADALAVARGRQQPDRAGWAARFRETMSERKAAKAR
jgi:bifunctional UDP-N-acetylglucosamine pyrophosphorylase/glucosamine-1-phosphate N-acetyltransferase